MCWDGEGSVDCVHGVEDADGWLPDGPMCVSTVSRGDECDVTLLSLTKGVGTGSGICDGGVNAD